MAVGVTCEIAVERNRITALQPSFPIGRHAVEIAEGGGKVNPIVGNRDSAVYRSFDLEIEQV